MIEGIFCLLLRQGSKQDKKLEVQLFLTRLLVPLALTGQPCFCLALETSIGFIVDFTIGGVESIGREITVGLLK